VSQLVELDVAEEAARHGEDEGCVKENESGLTDVRIVEEDETGGHQTSRKTVTRLPHDQVDHRDSQGAKKRRKRAEGDIGDLVNGVRVANIVEVEVAIVTDEPTDECKKKLAKGRVYVEEVSFFEIVGCKLSRRRIVSSGALMPSGESRRGRDLGGAVLSHLSEVNLIEDNLVRMADSPKTS